MCKRSIKPNNIPNFHAVPQFLTFNSPGLHHLFAEKLAFVLRTDSVDSGHCMCTDEAGTCGAMMPDSVYVER